VGGGHRGTDKAGAATDSDKQDVGGGRGGGEKGRGARRRSVSGTGGIEVKILKILKSWCVCVCV
jgi:hypothetical protein